MTAQLMLQAWTFSFSATLGVLLWLGFVLVFANSGVLDHVENPH
jgi:hypothetical protein